MGGRGLGSGSDELKRWVSGAEYMQNRLNPSLVLHFGRKVKNIWNNVLFLPLRNSK